ncbi:MAG: SCO family protein [Planctomycetes bacterium]|nr:SCO family protein [Planctomycetota bacterium]
MRASALGALALGAAPGLAQVIPEYQETAGVEVIEHVDDRLPLDLRFTNERGVHVKLGDYFTGEKPVILTLNYSSCPMLCSLQLNGMIEALRSIEETAGNEFELVTVSIDPLESFQRAAETRQKYLLSYGRPAAQDAWRFLTGDEASIQKLARAVGFGYRYRPEAKDYVHAAVFLACTPDGRISRYIYGVQILPQTLRTSLVEAGEGRVGSAFERFLLLCYHYDPATGRYGPAAKKIMRLGAGVTVVALGLCLFGMWRRETRRRRSAEVPA